MTRRAQASESQPADYSAAGRDQLVLVYRGQARSVIVVDEPGNRIVVAAAHELRDHIAQASGARLDIIGPSTHPNKRVEIHLGWGRLARVLAPDLEPEQYWIKVVGNRILLVGHDTGTPDFPVSPGAGSPATLWAVDYLLDHYIGVRWLWPGHGGAYVPRRSSIAIPRTEVLQQPPMLARSLRDEMARRPGGDLNILTDNQYDSLLAESYGWLNRHQMGRRASIFAPQAKAFNDWWDKYAETHPDYFAVPPAGSGDSQPFPSATRVKLRVGNPAVAAQVIEQWQAAGSPDFYDLAPADGDGWDTSDESRALDFPPNQPPLDIWLGKGNLSTRFVRFWNSVLEVMRTTNPNAHILSLAYDSYRDAPPPEAGVTVDAGTILGLVAIPWETDKWSAWTDAGADLYLRPNWWDFGADAPLLPVHLEGGYFAFARNHQMAGFDFDSLQGYWGTQALRYYIVARLSYRSDLAVDDVVDEFVGAFGPAAPAIRDYFEYWEAFTEAAAYPYGSGGTVEQNPDGLYAQAARAHGVSDSPLRGSYQVMPYLLTDEVLAPAFSKLDAAAALADSDEVRARVAFLKDGLTECQAVRDTLELGYANRYSTEFHAAAANLRKLRVEMTPRHVVWGGNAYAREQRLSVPTYPKPGSPPPSSYTVPRKSLTIDGDLRELDGVPGVDVAAHFNVYRGEPTVSGTVWLTYDDSFLYFAARLHDNVQWETQTGASTYLGDSIQWPVSAGGPGEAESWPEFELALTPDGPQVYRYTFPAGPSGLLDSIEIAIVRQESEQVTSYEVALPWDAVPLDPTTTTFSTSIAINDYDSKSEAGLLQWGGGIYGGKNNAHFIQGMFG